MKRNPQRKIKENRPRKARADRTKQGRKRTRKETNPNKIIQHTTSTNDQVYQAEQGEKRR